MKTNLIPSVGIDMFLCTISLSSDDYHPFFHIEHIIFGYIYLVHLHLFLEMMTRARASNSEKE